MAKLSELSIDKIRELAANNAGALLVLLPENISIFGTKEQREVSTTTVYYTLVLSIHSDKLIKSIINIYTY